MGATSVQSSYDHQKLVDTETVRISAVGKGGILIVEMD